MKTPTDLTDKEMRSLIEMIRDWLFLAEDTEENIRAKHGEEFAKKAREAQGESKLIEYLDPEKAWSPDILEGVARALEAYDLRPLELATIDEAYKT